MAHVVSLLCEGVFEKFPSLRFLFIEQDTFLVPGLMWHMDSDWKSLRDYTPWMKKLPSEYLRQHLQFGSQPMPDVPTKADLTTFLDGSGPRKSSSSQATSLIGTGTNRAHFWPGFPTSSGAE